MNIDHLDAEEREILNDFEADAFNSVLTPQRKKMFAQAAQATLQMKNVNVSISSRDLEVLQQEASEAGIPYTTLVSDILHKYVAGFLNEAVSHRAVTT